MKIKRANKYGFCFGVKRAINLAEQNEGARTFGELIHNQKEIERLKQNFSVSVESDIKNIPKDSKVIIRTHGIQKNDLEILKHSNAQIIDATCPFVTKPQKICEEMSKNGYKIIIFGDENHPEVKGVKSYCAGFVQVVLDEKEIDKSILGSKIALISQTTKNVSNFIQIASFLIKHCSEVRVFNTICNATFENQESIMDLAKECDVVIVVGGKQSSNTKQLLNISLEFCKNSHCVEDENELEKSWFLNKKLCGISAGASTPDWIIERVENKIKSFCEK